MRLTIRVFLNGQLDSEETLQGTEEALLQTMPAKADRHIKLAASNLVMVEFEFLDEPDEQQRFFRVGNDPSRMVRPMEIIQ